MSVYHFPITLSIANGAAISDGWAVGAAYPVGLIMPAAWDAANVGFSVSLNGTNYFPLYDQYGNEVSIAAAAGNAVPLDPWTFVGFPYLKIRSGTVAAPVNQTAARAATLSIRQ